MTGRAKKEFIKKGKQITESRELKIYGNLIQKNKIKDKQMMLIMKVVDTDRVMCVFTNNTYNIYKYNSNY